MRVGLCLTASVGFWLETEIPIDAGFLNSSGLFVVIRLILGVSATLLVTVFCNLVRKLPCLVPFYVVNTGPIEVPCVGPMDGLFLDVTFVERAAMLIE